MKNKYILTIFILIVFFGCNDPRQPLNKVKVVELGAVQVIEVDSCEYVTWKAYDTGGIVHKQNCKFCTNRFNK